MEWDKFAGKKAHTKIQTWQSRGSNLELALGLEGRYFTNCGNHAALNFGIYFFFPYHFLQ